MQVIDQPRGQKLMRPMVWILPVLMILAALVYMYGGDVYGAFISWIYAEQRAFHTSMTSSLSAFADAAGVSTGFAVVSGSFLYGVFHAAGPGHGKVILSTYLLAQPEQIRKSVLMSIAAALMQGVMAVLLVYGLFYVFGFLSKDAKIAVAWSERLAYVLVMGVGVMLLWRGIRGLNWWPRAKSHYDHDHHHHDHSVNADGVCSSCGHAHVPTAEQVNTATDWRATLGIIMSIGFRPCSGAVLVLVFAKFAQIPMVGVLAVAAISVGTAITVSALAILSVQARKLAVSLLDGAVGMADRIGHGLALAGGFILILMGYGLIAASFTGPVRSMGL